MSSILRSVRAVKYASSPIRFIRVQPGMAAAFSAAAARYKNFPPHTVIDMPALSPTMETGNVGNWKKNVGEKLSPGDVLVEIETDKATMDFEFQEEGYLAKILLEEGTRDVPVGKPMGVYCEEADDVPAFENFTLGDAADSGAASVSSGVKLDKPEEKEQKSEEKNESDNKHSSSKPQQVTKAEAGKIFASPLAKTLALQKGIKISDVKGTGPNGRIVARDIEDFAPESSKSVSSGASTLPAATAYEDQPISNMRSTIAKRLRQSKNESPDFIVSSAVSVSKLLQLRESLNASSEGAYKISVNDILIKALALAARKVPAVNTHWLESEKVLREYHNVDVSVAVATPKGLITPIVTNAEAKGLSEISSQVKDLAKRARDNKLKPEEYQGGTITISNMGMNHAVSIFTAIINPPQSTIVAIGTTERKAVEDPLAENGIAFDDVMNITGTFDHRVVDGAVAGEYMKALKNVLENPLQLLL